MFHHLPKTCEENCRVLPASECPDALLDALSQLLVLLTIHVDVIDGLKGLALDLQLGMG